MVYAGNTLHGESIKVLYPNIVDGHLNSGEGTYTHQKIIPEYIGTIVSDIKLEKPLNIAVDCGNGVAGVLAPSYLPAWLRSY